MEKPTGRPGGFRAPSIAAGIASATFVCTVVLMTGTVIPTEEAGAVDSSAATVRAADYDLDFANSPFPNLEVTVSQTVDLGAQGITVSWTGGGKSTVPSGQTGGENFFQIAQCWDDDGNGKPDRTTCQYGAFNTPGAARDNFISDPSKVAPLDAEFTSPPLSIFNPTYTSIPFRSATGVTVASVLDNVKVPVDVNTNQFFTRLTSNEISWAGSSDAGEGSVKFELQTAAQSPGLGCGAPTTAISGEVTGAPCWLVIIPRGTEDLGEENIIRSGLFWPTWKHHIGVKLDFKPLGVRCTIGAPERQLAGSELASGAIASWQPVLCGSSGGSAYSLVNVADSDATVAANGTAPAPLALTSRPLPAGASDSLRYAPIALTGLAVTFAIDRVPRVGSDVPTEILERVRLPFQSMRLTPRLVAKLLTNSYLDSVPGSADRSHLGFVSPAEPGPNPRNITFDPEFLAINDPEWTFQALAGQGISDLLVPQGRSDAAWAIWQYVLSDAKAVAFLNGEPDESGMKVNPWSSTSEDINPSGVALSLPRDGFPKADPVEQAATPEGGSINLITWRPYTIDFDASAFLTLRGDAQGLGNWDPNALPPRYGRSSRDVPGLQKVMGVSTIASASRYQVVTAELLNPAGEFVGPTNEGLTAAAAAMSFSAVQSQVVEFDPKSSAAKSAREAYPLAMPIYAATNPASTDPVLRASYAAFIRYAANTGQVVGTAEGQLPAGYAPIPEAWRIQALAAAGAIELGVRSAAPPSTTGNLTPRSTGQSNSGGLGAVPPAVPSDPNPTGEISGALVGNETPADPVAGAVAAAVPLILVAGISAALAVPFISRIRRPS